MKQVDINAIAARVISIEADALHQMAGDLPGDFSDAVEAILQTKGRVIVSGVGKSGHIGNKIYVIIGDRAPRLVRSSSVNGLADRGHSFEVRLG